MRLFLDLAFPLAFILMPLVVTFFISNCEEDPQRRKRTYRLSTALWVATVLAAAVVIALWASGYGRVGSILWMIVIPLWFGLAMPLASARNPDWRRSPMPIARAARVTPRRDPSPASWPVLAFAASLVVALAAGTVALLQRVEPFHWSLLAFPVAGGVWLFFAGFMQRAGYREPEPMPPVPAAELERAYDELRQWLRKVFFWFGIAGSITFATIGLIGALAVAGFLPGSAAGIAGGGLGTVFGFAGSVVGVRGTEKRSRINRLYREAIERMETSAMS